MTTTRVPFLSQTYEGYEHRDVPSEDESLTRIRPGRHGGGGVPAGPPCLTCHGGDKFFAQNLEGHGQVFQFIEEDDGLPETAHILATRSPEGVTPKASPATAAP